MTNRFAEANAAGLGVFRVFAAGGDFSGFVLQPGPGERCICCLGREAELIRAQCEVHAAERLFSGASSRRHPSELPCCRHAQVRRNERTALAGCGTGAPLAAAALTGLLSAQSNDMYEGPRIQGKIESEYPQYLLPAACRAIQRSKWCHECLALVHVQLLRA